MNQLKNPANSRSDYEYIIHKGYIAIKDLNLGRMSVTNNIECVVQEICAKENIHPYNHKIIYQDSDGIVDGFDWKTQSFIPIEPRDYTVEYKEIFCI